MSRGRELARYKYGLSEDKVIQTALRPTYTIRTRFVVLCTDGTLIIKAGYAWDGSSVPLKNIIGFLTFGRCDLDRYCKTASLIHDALYQLMRAGLLHRSYKAYSDYLYKAECVKGGMTKWEADKRHTFLKKWGNVNKKAKPEKVFEV